MMKPLDLRDIDCRVIEGISLRRCNTFTGKALAGSRPSGDLSADLIQQLSCTLEHIRHTSMLDDNLKQSFRRHQEKLRELLKSKMETSIVSDKPSLPAEDSLTENKPATRGKLRSTTHKTESIPTDTAVELPEVTAGMKMQQLMQDQKVTGDALEPCVTCSDCYLPPFLIGPCLEGAGVSPAEQDQASVGAQSADHCPEGVHPLNE